MKILFRVDSSSAIGIGHVIRCVALAESLKKSAHITEFFSKPLPGNRNDYVRSLGFTVHEDTPLLQYDYCIVDHYKLGASDEDQLRKFSKKIGVIDDFGARVHNADFIIDPSISALSTERKKLNPNTPFYTGPDWLMLREEFRHGHQIAKVRMRFDNIMIFFGGTDPQRMTVPYLKEITRIQSEVDHLVFNVIVPSNHPDQVEILKLSLPESVKIHLNPPSISRLILENDLYLGSGGTITWERMCLGLPGLVVSIVDNQEDIAKTLDGEFHQYLGKSDRITPKAALVALKKALLDPEKLIKFSQKSLQLIDGNGVKRILSIL